VRTVGPALSDGAAPAFVGSPWRDAAGAAVAHAPYLARLIERRPDLIVDLDAHWPARLVANALDEAAQIAADPPSITEAMPRLRRAKDAAHLAVAIADLARVWSLDRVTGAITEFADAALKAAVAVATRESRERGDIAGDGEARGLALIAMGKMGAHELNYSSDIDVSVFFDAEILPVAHGREPRVVAVRMVAPLVRVLEEVTSDGYVFRTDLRLRPDPGSTPVAVSMAFAETYYQSLGQNWERAAFIKARAAAGDIESGQTFLASLAPFIWRKHLDFAAVEDVYSIKRQILSVHKSAELGQPVFDVKLGRGGIRDIELFAQTQQLVLGGRNPDLRGRATLPTLVALAKAGAIAEEAHAALVEAYVFFREVEHRIQMLEDAQTHAVPGDPETRTHVAALAGFSDLGAFDAAIVEHRRIVAEIDRQLFGGGKSLADPLGSLSFTGVDDNPETVRTIEKLGFRDGRVISQTIRGWHHGRIRAMRSERARELLTRLTPRLLRALAGAGDPDQSFARFRSFFEALSAGVQVLALLDARPALLNLLARLLSESPRLAEALAHRPSLLDIVIEPRFAAPVSEDSVSSHEIALAGRCGESETFEAKLNAARRYQREEAFRIAVQVLEGNAAAAHATNAYADLAEACVRAMSAAALAEMERLHGPQPGAFAVCALGKFGGRELLEGSDLDLMLVYDAPERAEGSGLAPGEYYARLTQRLISALSSPTEEGALYEIDTKLRPSGSKGPLAVRLSSFARYFAEEAWTWELQALTRLRPVAGDQDLVARVQAISLEAIAQPRDAEKVLADVATMRGRMAKERPHKHRWALKLAPGGFVDIEFIIQALQLIGGGKAPEIVDANSEAALGKLVVAGMISPSSHERLAGALALWRDLTLILRVCLEGEPDPTAFTDAVRRRLAQAAGEDSFAELEKRVAAIQTAVRAEFAAIIGPVGDGNAALIR
jgi:glutamate-ammonia-ligase adenylyltransferase